MSFAGKRRVLHVGLVLFTLWPLVHIYLALRFDLSAWKLAGWGMYATPRPASAGIAVLGRRSGSTRFEEIQSVPLDFQAHARRYLDRQRWLGQLLRPDQLARLLQAHLPGFADLRIMVYTPTLDRQTGMIVLKPTAYDYVGSK